MSDPTSTPPTHGDETEHTNSGIARTIAVVGGLIIATLIATFTTALVTITVIGRDAGTTTTFVASLLGTELTFLLIGAIYLHFRPSHRLLTKLPTREASPVLLIGLLLSFITAFLSIAITDTIIPAIELSPGYAEYSQLNSVTGTGLLLAAILSLIVVGPVEEFFFRGVVQTRLREALTPVSSIIIAGAAFALFHVYTVALLAPPAAVLIHMLAYYTSMGMIFGWVYHRTETLTAPALVHGVFNATIFLIPLVG
ncbi:abortive phage infection protein [Haloprofundus marisrubri]|uniref:Abortive phage infection protein n=1 Tax=Haloprofundus marisrubri TaxID=1514971 RepID=A0A0W1R8S8_9EURY|nr:type II CAAX endopeptidase family protein [Haloprofundus marisrubri]KTG09554.1 abortive phage infection protein [Haloprofundus marisrubri]